MNSKFQKQITRFIAAAIMAAAIILIFKFSPLSGKGAGPVDCSQNNIRCVGSGQEYGTIQTAATDAVAGDTVYVFDGNYAGFKYMGPNTGTVAAPVIFQAQSHNVVINGAGGDSAGDAINIENVSYVTIDGFTIQNSVRDGIRTALTTGVVIKNNVVTGAGRQGILTGFAVGVQVLNNTISGTRGQHGIYVSNSAVANDNPVIRGNISFNNAGNGFQVNGDCSTTDPNDVTDGVIGGALIENNIIHDNAFKGFSFISMQNSLVRNNLLYNNGTANAGAGGIHLADQGCGFNSDSNTIVNNTIIEPRITGIRITSGANNVIFNNIVIAGSQIVDESGSTNFIDATSNFKQTAAAGIFTNTAAADYTLASASPALNVGKSSYQSKAAPAMDFLGNQRPGGGVYDVGAYESGSSQAPADNQSPTVPSGLTAHGISPTAISLSWDTSSDNVELAGYKIYRAGVLVGILSTNNYSDSALSPATNYSYTVAAYDSSGNISSQSTSAQATTLGQVGCLNIGAAWQSRVFTDQTGNFTITFDATPFANPNNTAMGISTAAPNSYANLAAIVRFNNTGTIDARNGSAYSATSNITYTPNTLYHFRLNINIPAHTYSAYVTPNGGSELTIGTNFAFRSEQLSATHLSYFGSFDDTGSLSVCSISLNGSGGSSTPLSGDFNLDHVVNALDFSILNSRWLQNYPGADINLDGLINSLDFAVLKSNWAKVW